MICQKCNKDHKIKQTGELNVCEREAYFFMGAKGVDQKGKTIYGFGLGQNRFQFPDAK